MSVLDSLHPSARKRELNLAAQRQRAESKALADQVAADVVEERAAAADAPRRLDWGLVAQAVPMAFASGTLVAVPDSRLSVEPLTERVTVRCECGEEPTIAVAASELCGCARLYVNIGRGKIRGCRVEPEEPDA